MFADHAMVPTPTFGTSRVPNLEVSPTVVGSKSNCVFFVVRREEGMDDGGDDDDVDDDDDGGEQASAVAESR